MHKMKLLNRLTLVTLSSSGKMDFEKKPDHPKEQRCIEGVFYTGAYHA